MCLDEKVPLSSSPCFLTFLSHHFTNLSSSSPFLLSASYSFRISSIRYLCPLLRGIIRSLHVLSLTPYSRCPVLFIWHHFTATSFPIRIPAFLLCARLPGRTVPRAIWPIFRQSWLTHSRGSLLR